MAFQEWNSHPQACTASPFTHWAISLALLKFLLLIYFYLRHDFYIAQADLQLAM